MAEEINYRRPLMTIAPPPNDAARVRVGIVWHTLNYRAGGVPIGSVVNLVTVDGLPYCFEDQWGGLWQCDTRIWEPLPGTMPLAPATPEGK